MSSFLFGAKIGAIALAAMLILGVVYAHVPLWWWLAIVPAAAWVQRGLWRRGPARPIADV